MDTPVLPAAADPFAVALPPRPYPGLRPFEQTEWPIFFGRETMTVEIIDRLLVQRLLLVHGDSGCGKSSLVRAGVQAQLEQEQARSGHRWLTVSMRPGESPLWAMAVALAQGGDQARVRDLRRLLNRGHDAAAGLDTALGLAPTAQLCLLVDQFEELFRFAREGDSEEARLFAEVLVGLAARPPRGLYVILTMRSEFLGHCARYEGFAESVNRAAYLLPRMDRAALVRAIREPARLYGGTIDPALAEVLISDAGGSQDELPLIQHGLLRLWLAGSAPTGGPAAAPRLGLADYGAGGGLTALLSAHADAVLDDVAPAGDGSRRRWVEHLFRALTDINADGHAVRRPRPLGELVTVTGAPPAALRGIIDAFRTEGVSFLTPYGDAAITDDTRIDLGHEALVRCWRRIADPQTGWLQREFKDGRTWQTLRVLGETFQGDPEKTLSPAATLDLAAWIRTLPSAAWTARYGGGYDQVQRFIAASEEALWREQEEIERQRLLEQRQRIMEARQRVRGRFLVFVAVLAVVAITLAAVAFNQRQEAVIQSNELNRLVAELRLQTQAAATATSPNGQWVASVDGRNRLYLMDLATGMPVPVPADCAQVHPDLTVFSPTGNRIAVASGGDIWVLDLDLRQCALLRFDDQAGVGASAGVGNGDGTDPTQRGIRSVIRRVAFSPDGQLLATGGDGGDCHIWNLTTRTLTTSLGCPGTIVDIAFDTNGKRLICKVSDGRILEWASASGDFRDDIQLRKVAAPAVPARLYLHVQSEDDRLSATAWQRLLEQADIVVPGIELVGSRAPRRSELRFFRRAEAEQAGQLREQLQRAGATVELRYIAGYEDSKDIRPRHFELWFAADAIGYWFPVVASIADRAPAFDKARSIQAQVPDYLVQVFEAADAKGRTMYAVTLGGYLTESEARSRVDFARGAIDPTAYAWESRIWRTNLFDE